MGLDFTSTKPTEVADVRRFLAWVFRTPESAPFLSAALMDWKYFAPRPGWDGPRSYTLRRDGRIVAHGCAHPVTFATCAGPVSSLRVIDWAGAPDVPGAGVLLFRRFAAFADTLLAVGGSEQTQAILPKIGFRRIAEIHLFAKPVRPWLQARTRPETGWKAAARLLRNSVWAARKGVAAPESWQAERTPAFDSVQAPEPWPGSAVSQRSPELLNAMLGCPGAAMSGFVFPDRGYCVLSRVRGQARIADIWAARGMWETAYTVAARVAAQDRATAEIMAVASTADARRALAANGFIPRGVEPVFLFDPKKKLEGAELKLELLDGDEFYLDNPAYPYLT